jgi:hypothetical protein
MFAPGHIKKKNPRQRRHARRGHKVMDHYNVVLTQFVGRIQA